MPEANQFRGARALRVAPTQRKMVTSVVDDGSGTPNGKVGEVLSPLPSDVPKFVRQV